MANIKRNMAKSQGLTGLRLFDLGTPRPTTREVADLVRAGGVDALTSATARADAARYQEVRCRSALNAVQGMPFAWTLNPYRGCTHGCHYCYARRYQSQFALGGGDEFSSIIFVKSNFVDVLRRELARASWRADYVAIGTATDCYQPIEGHYKLTRGTLEALHERGNPAGVITKGPMVVRDKDLLVAMTRAAGVTVHVSVATIDDAAWRQLEPGTAPPMQRLRAVRELAEAGVRVGVLMNPIVPGITSRPALLDETVKAIADHGASFLGANVMFLQGDARTHFMRWLSEAQPSLVAGYERLYTGKYPDAEYRRAIVARVDALRRKYRLLERDAREPHVASAAAREAAQRMLDWSDAVSAPSSTG
jgi:DNA repair photolyase